MNSETTDTGKIETKNKLRGSQIFKLNTNVSRKIVPGKFVPTVFLEDTCDPNKAQDYPVKLTTETDNQSDTSNNLLGKKKTKSNLGMLMEIDSDKSVQYEKIPTEEAQNLFLKPSISPRQVDVLPAINNP